VPLRRISSVLCYLNKVTETRYWVWTHTLSATSRVYNILANNMPIEPEILFSFQISNTFFIIFFKAPKKTWSWNNSYSVHLPFYGSYRSKTRGDSLSEYSKAHTTHSDSPF
jgi:hypothetical protein